ncbi:RNA-directed DNA polymerase [Stenotrophomonas maltophilia]|uniref:RNA-directed DNA polymerase n=1 Tax=Stenotrophomonas maltophilia TaxID=40324 RepID=UPI0030182514
MFALTAQELENSFSAIQHHGYSAMLPAPPEWDVVVANWPAIRDAIAQIDLDTYTPRKPMLVFSPKNRANVRALHLLHPQDLLIYTALTLIAKNDIEANRIPVRSKRVFSYRAEPTKDGELYNARGAYDLYQTRLAELAERPAFKYVAIADIADFYARIYQHRLENVIESVATTQRVRDVARVLVKKLIGSLMGKDSYGIPIGPYASRLLAEALLIDVDTQLSTSRVQFARWVDDFVIYTKSEHEAQSILFTLGEWLYTRHGLTLQSAKTQILTIASYRDHYLIHHDDRLTDRDAVVQMFRDTGNDYGDADEPSEEEIQEMLNALQGHDVVGILRASMQDTELVDYQAVTYALTKLPRIPGAPADLKREVLDIVIENAELLYPVAEHIATYVLSFDDLTRAERKSIAKKLLKPLQSKRRPPPPYYAMWILHIFASSPDWNHANEIMRLFSDSSSEVIRRSCALVIHKSGTRAQAVAMKDAYDRSSHMLRLGILCATHKLGADERRHWKLVQGVNGVIEKLV